ncbi:MAG: pallilysin-related adhesin [Spirochaetaceae bacterium]|jgi:hypothetical protein|nr:pallilysin-related adhesin [Spirochaetaceae bacterium]
MKRSTLILTLVAFGCTAAMISALIFSPLQILQHLKKERPNLRSTGAPDDFAGVDLTNLRTFKASAEPLVGLENGELVVAVLSEDFDGDGMEEQIIAYRNFGASGGAVQASQVHITFVDYNMETGEYGRIYNDRTPSTRPGTVALYTQDLIGDHRGCIIVSGMNENEEKTMSVYRWTSGADKPVAKIAEIVTDGSISILDTERPDAYMQGLTSGQSYAIQVRSSDPASRSGLDQIETTWTYNGAKGVYEKRGDVRLPGARIDTRAVRELLGGSSARFEQFVGGLWYHVSQSGTVDSDQYIYFDTESREIIFYGDNTQQVYTWRNSSTTRFGIYISSQNILVPTMNRIIDLELESADSIRVRVFEDVRMRIQVSAPWDGSYRKANIAANKNKRPAKVTTFISGIYDCAFGRIRFSADGTYDITQAGISQNGAYSFFMLGDVELFEIRPKMQPEEKNTRTSLPAGQETYRVERAEDGSFKLIRVRIGTQGISEYHEVPVILMPVHID